MFETSKTSGGRGITYETRMCILCVIRGYTRGFKKYKLAYQVSQAGTFDDVVFDEGGKKYQLFQLKHKEENQLKISHSQLFNEKFNTDYNLIKYVKAFKDVSCDPNFKNTIKMAVVFTNIGFCIKDNQLSLITNQRPKAKIWYDGLTSIQLIPCTLDATAIFDNANLFPDAKCYKFDEDENIIKILKRQAKTLAEEMTKNPKWQNGKDKNQQDKLKKQEEALIRDLESFTEDEIREALQYIVYAVGQPNDKELEDIIKSEISDYFKIQNPDAVYNILDKQFRDWCDRKEPLEHASLINQLVQKQHTISYEDVDKIFQIHVKNVSFGLTLPTRSFTGRVKELESIKEKLKEKHDLIVSQTVAISGLGGIGKTELTKQFINQFGQSEFYGRIIWIEAESDGAVEKSFERLAEQLNIDRSTSKATTTIIDEVFKYFEGLKILFVFDNYDKTSNKKENLVGYCHGKVSKHRPYFLFTSRNRQCLPGVSSLDLSVFHEEDAKQFIKMELVNIICTKQEIEKLVKTLQYFPLALKQAVAYIKEQDKIESVFGTRYDIQKYFLKFNEESPELLNFSFPGDDFGKYGKTTFMTWDITMDAVKRNEKGGKNAIEILKLLSYLYADKIDPKMFLSRFNNDLEKTGKAFLLLEEYSMITKIDGKSTFYQIHRLVQAVVQFKFKENDEEIFEQAMNLIDPELCKSYFDKNTPRSDSLDLMKKCTIDQFLHYNSLSNHIKKHESLDLKFRQFFHDLHSRVLYSAALNDDLNKIKEIDVTKDELTEFTRRNIEDLVRKGSNKVIKYLIEIECLKLNESIDRNSLIKMSKRCNNLDLFKFLIEKDEHLSEILKFAPVELISEIIKGKVDLLQNIISKSEMNHKILEILEETLLFAIMFDQESIVKLLIELKVKPLHKIGNWRDWSPIIFAAIFNNTNIRKTVFQFCDKLDLKHILFEVLDDKSFISKSIFQIIFKQYRELGGSINDQDSDKNSFLYVATKKCRFNDEKLMIVKFLLDNDADPTLTTCAGNNALVNILRIKNLCYDSDINDNNSLLDDIYNEMVFSKMSPEKFMTVLGNGLFTVKYWMDLDQFKKLFYDILKEIGDINVKNDEGETLLIRYLKNVNCEIDNIEFLVENGADVNATGNQGKNAIYYAVYLEKDEIFMYLLNKGCSVDEEVLLEAIKKDKLSMVKKLFETRFTIDHQFVHGQTPIKVAVEHISPNIALFMKKQFQEFVDRGGHVNKRDKDGRTLLVKYVQKLPWIISTNFTKTLNNIKFLIEIGYKVDEKDNEGRNSLYYAVNLEKDDIFMYLLNKVSSVDEEVLLEAIKKDKLSIVKKLFDTYFSVDHVYIKVAVEHNSPNIALFMKKQFQEFLDRGGVLNNRDDKGPTLLIKYVRSLHTNCTSEALIDNIKFLIKIGVDVDKKDNYGKSALHYSVNLKKDDIFMYLLNKGSTVDEEVLLEAIKKDKLSMVKKLFETHFTVDHKFFDDKTSIQVAADHVSPKVVIFLKKQLKQFLDKGGNINKRDKDNQTLLLKYVQELSWISYSANISEDLDNVKFLIESGADIKAKDNDGEDALHYAVNLETEEIFMYLLSKVVGSVNENILVRAIQQQKVRIVKELIPKYFSKSHCFQSLNNKTPLNLMIEYNAGDIQTFLKLNDKTVKLVVSGN